MTSNFICIAGTAKNWAWSFIDYDKDKKLNPSYLDNQPAPSQLVNVKKPGYILWAFREERDYDNLSDLVQENEYVRCVLITNRYSSRFQDQDYYMPRGIMAFGRIDKESLMGKIPWNYWPKGKEWNYKFFIRIERIAPGVERSLNILSNLNRQNFDQNLDEVFVQWARDIINVIPSNVTQGSLFKIDEDTFKTLELMALIKWGHTASLIAKTPSITKANDLKMVLILHLLAGKNVIIFGPPGAGKTELAKKLTIEVCGSSGYDLVTGNPQWTTYNTIGGPRLPSGDFKPGFLTVAIVNCWRHLKKYGTPCLDYN